MNNYLITIACIVTVICMTVAGMYFETLTHDKEIQCMKAGGTWRVVNKDARRSLSCDMRGVNK